MSFLLRMAHDKAAKKEIHIENLMRAQVKELKAQIAMGQDITEPQPSQPRARLMQIARPYVMESW